VVIWRVTEACNLGCGYCEYRRGRGGRRHAAAANEVLAFGRALGEYAAATGREVLVSWLGGEPLLWPPLWEVGSALRHAFGLALSVTTNGTRLGQPGVLRRLADDYAEVTLSVDGPAWLHDDVREAPGLHAKLGAAVGALRAQRARLGRGPLVRANVVLMRSNLRRLEAMGRELAGWGVEALTFNTLGGQPADPFFERERLRPADVDWLMSAMPRLRERLAERGLGVCGSDRYLRRLAASALGQSLPVDDCAPGQQTLFVDEHGRAGACAFTAATHGVPIAEVRRGDEVAALPARLRARLRQKLAACLDCHSTQVFGKFVMAA
jgi:MoaA/NifB/PqqE/SkfB family radical SAM enzyme